MDEGHLTKRQLLLRLAAQSLPHAVLVMAGLWAFRARIDWLTFLAVWTEAFILCANDMTARATDELVMTLAKSVSMLFDTLNGRDDARR